MLAKRALGATLALLLTGGCSVPWKKLHGPETNLTFRLVLNQPVLTSVLINGQRGKFILATAHSQTIVDTNFSKIAGMIDPPEARINLSLSRIRSTSPLIADLEGVADAMIGSDIWRRHIVSIDYGKGIVTIAEPMASPFADLRRFPFEDEPTLPITLSGAQLHGVVDTTVPDTVIFPISMRPPGMTADRARLPVRVGGFDLGPVDVAFRNTGRILIGNRVLSRFLLIIDYPGRQTAIWPVAPEMRGR